MKSSFPPSLIPACLWVIADTLALADLILRLTEEHVILDILYVPIAIVLLFSTCAAIYLRRYNKEQKAMKAAAAAETTEVSDSQQA
jgi:hypothetical protein